MNTEIMNTVYMVTKSILPYCFVESVGFRNLITLLVVVLTLPKRAAVMNKVSSTYDILASQVHEELPTATTLSMTTSGQSDLNLRGYLGFKIHYLDPETGSFIKSVMLTVKLTKLYLMRAEKLLDL